MSALDMRRVVAFVALLLACGAPHAARHPEASAPAFYVATDGDDRAAGTREAPFATIAHARDAARLVRRDIVVRGGTYFLAEPIVIAPEDSGLGIRAAPGEHVVLSGGRRIDGFREMEANGHRVWTALAPGPWFRELFVNRERRARTRLPKMGYFHPTELPDVKGDDFGKESKWLEGESRFRFAPGNLKAWTNLHDVEVVALHFWVESRMPIASVDERERLATFTRPSVFRLTEGFSPATARYYVENVFEALDTPGQWYLDRTTSILTYLPLPGEELAKTEVIAPRLEELVRFEGKPAEGRFVEHVTLRGLELRDAESNRDVPASMQAAVNVPAAITMTGTRDSTLEDLVIKGVGGYAIALGAGCRRDRIARCDLGDLAAGGIQIGEQTARTEDALQTGDNVVTDCHVHDGGIIHRSAVGIWIGQSAGNVIAHNHVHDFDYTAISAGWTWGYKPSPSNRNMIEKNRIHDIGRGVLSDLAGVYTLGISPGTVITGNVIHDVSDFAYGGWGIYFDEGTTGVVAENNVVYRTQSGGWFQNYGKDNVVRNNVFALSREGQLMRGREDGSISFERNIIYYREGELLAWSWKSGDFRFDHDVYWNARGPVTFAGATWDEWRARGMDAHSLIADPLFIDPDHGDFRLRPGSPALAAGFTPIDVHDVGPRP